MDIVMGGDVALCRRVEKKILEGNTNLLIQDLQETFNHADLSIVNLECPITDSDDSPWDFPTLKGSIKSADLLRDLGVHITTLANNHILDYGPKGLTDTLLTLDALNIQHCGAGFSSEQAMEPLIIEHQGIKIGIIALAQPEISIASKGGCGAALLQYDIACEKIKNLRKSSDIVIALLHFGIEFFEYPTPSQVNLSRKLIDLGAKLVIGHHPHVPQGFEYYKDGFIAYSIGNLIFDQPSGRHKFSKTGLIINARFDGKNIKHVDVIPYDTTFGITRKIEGESYIEVMSYLDNLSGVLRERSLLLNHYYFTSRDNFLIHIRALLYYVFKKADVKAVKNWVKQQWWPQLLSLRIDLFRFVLSGQALDYEKRKGKPQEGAFAYVWRGICCLGKVISIVGGRNLAIK